MRWKMLFFVLACAGCNAIDGADGYTKVGADASSDAPCNTSCLDTAGVCLASCGTTRDSCKATCGNPGACNKCDSDYNTCTTGCVSQCTSCDFNCNQTQCTNAPQPTPDAGGSDAGVD